MKKKAIFLVTLALCISCSLSAATLTVCASGCDHPTIQSAIDAANSGDVIDIQDAVHTEAAITVNKNLTIQGQGQSTTIVQAAPTEATADDGVFFVSSGLTVLFRDLTIQHGNAKSGGDITFADGGGLFISCNLSTDVSCERVTITNNRAEDDGGGVYIVGFSGIVRFTDCVISNNEANTSGFNADGGGIYNTGADVFELIRCTISGNTAGNGGGGGYIDESGSANKFINCTIYDNTAGGVSSNHIGGGIRLREASSSKFINCTIVDNKLTTDGNRVGGGIAWSNGALILTNTIVANNSGASSATNGDDIWASQGGNMPITSSLVEDCDGCRTTPTYTTDPNLAAVAFCGEQAYFEPQSPSDALGNGTALGGDVPTDDICGNPRIQQCVAIGSFEAISDPVYMSQDIGDVSGNTGNTVNSIAGTYTVTTSGKGIKGTADGFHFDYFDPIGDIDLIVRVTGIQNNANRQAGLMLREHLGPGAPNVALLVNGQRQVKLTSRSSDGGPTITRATKSANSRLNSWLRLTRTDNNVTAYYSPNGTIWEYVGNTIFEAPCRYLAGMATSKGAGGGMKVFSYDNFTINGVSPTPPPPRLAVAASQKLSVVAFPNPFQDQLSYRLEGVQDKAQVRLLDMTGRVITMVETLDSNVSTMVINTSEIAVGIYFLEIRTGDERKLVKVVKR